VLEVTTGLPEDGRGAEAQVGQGLDLGARGCTYSEAINTTLNCSFQLFIKQLEATIQSRFRKSVLNFFFQSSN